MTALPPGVEVHPDGRVTVDGHHAGRVFRYRRWWQFRWWWGYDPSPRGPWRRRAPVRSDAYTAEEAAVELIRDPRSPLPPNLWWRLNVGEVRP